MSEIERMPPHDKESEILVLSGMLNDSPNVAEVISVLGDNDLFFDGHQKIFRAIIKVWEKSPGSKRIDAGLVAEELRKSGDMPEIGYEAFGAIITADPIGMDCIPRAHIVRAYSLRRKIIHFASDAQVEAYHPACDADDLIGKVQREAIGLGSGLASSETHDLASVVKSVQTEIDLRCAKRGALTGIPSGLLDLDNLTAGFHGGELTILAARPSVGKAQPLESLVLTPNGFVKMGSLSVGDLIVGSDGLPHKVTGIYPQGILPVFQVSFSDGAKTECCDDHLWFTRSRSESRRGLSGSVKNLKEIRESLTVENGSRTNHHIPLVAPVELDGTSDLPLDPWVLGAYLGDGCCSEGGSVLLTNREQDVVAKFNKQLPLSDVLSDSVDGLSHRVRRSSRTNKPSDTKTILESLSLVCKDCYNKFVPSAYKYGPREIRLEVLRGILDTDGFVENRGVEISTSSKMMRDDITFLVRSLGGLVTVNEHIPTFTVDGVKKLGAIAYRMYLWFSNGIVPVSSAKHLAKWKHDKAIRRTLRGIADVKFVGEKECQCITVDSPDRLYVTDDFILTHNSALAMQIARAAATDGFPTLVFSLEMHRNELVSRVLCGDSGVDSYSVRRGRLDKDQVTKIIASAGSISTLPIFINDACGQRVRNIIATSRRLKASQNIGLVIIDYLQLITPDESKMSRNDQVATMSRGLKLLARDLNIPVLCLSQLSRGVEQRGAGAKPQLSDLRDSGAIEQDADTVLFLHRSSERNFSDPVEQIEAIVAKQRNGPTGDITLSFRKANLRFENWSPMVGPSGEVR